MLTEADRLEMLKAIGAEQFDTGKPEKLWAVFEGEFNDPEVSGIGVNGEIVWLECRLSDKEFHGLTREQRITRLLDGTSWHLKNFEPSRSSGFVVVRLSK